MKNGLESMAFSVAKLRRVRLCSYAEAVKNNNKKAVLAV
jgi:hypothetical protein